MERWEIKRSLWCRWVWKGAMYQENLWNFSLTIKAKLWAPILESINIHVTRNGVKRRMVGVDFILGFGILAQKRDQCQNSIRKSPKLTNLQNSWHSFRFYNLKLKRIMRYDFHWNRKAQIFVYGEICTDLILQFLGLLEIISEDWYCLNHSIDFLVFCNSWI